MIPKHGKLSARTKKCAKYRDEGRRAKNKAKHIEAQKTFTAKKRAKRLKRLAKSAREES